MFIFYIVGFCSCIVGILSMALGVPTLKIGGVTLEGILNTEAEVTVGTVYAAMATGMILYAGEAVPAKFSEYYFKRELADGTPVYICRVETRMNYTEWKKKASFASLIPSFFQIQVDFLLVLNYIPGIRAQIPLLLFLFLLTGNNFLPLPFLLFQMDVLTDTFSGSFFPGLVLEKILPPFFFHNDTFLFPLYLQKLFPLLSANPCRVFVTGFC